MKKVLLLIAVVFGTSVMVNAQTEPAKDAKPMKHAKHRHHKHAKKDAAMATPAK